jgi:hypothetical protein
LTEINRAPETVDDRDGDPTSLSGVSRTALSGVNDVANAPENGHDGNDDS